MYPRSFLPTPSTPLYGPCTLIYSYGFLHIPSTFLYLSSDNTSNEFAGQRRLGSSLVKPRSKRSSHHPHSTKLSIKDLALELAKKHVSCKLFLDIKFT